MRARNGIALGLVSLALAGCSGWQSALDPQGPEARHLAELIWIFTAVCAAVWLAVMIGLLIGLLRRKTPYRQPIASPPASERTALRVIGALAAATAVVVLALTFLSYVSQRKLYAKSDPAVKIEITGHQWWWEVRYDEPRPDQKFTTANEIHIPVGEPVRFKLQSTDVIHSFWVPSLHGKMDLIPGQVNELQIVAERPGIYRGQCAEFCGLQHAKMGMLVVAMPRAEYDAWRDKQIKPASPPTDPQGQKGQEVFLTKPCVMCHTVRGTPAGSRVGPELTHLMSRRYLAAGTLPLTRGNLASWIIDPHGSKPGVNMPVTRLAADEQEALLSYLEGLQ
jgi:cytochrome c oxidase subunit 2